MAIGAADADYDALGEPRRRPALRADHVGGNASRAPSGSRSQSRRARTQRCERCWHYRADVGSRCRHPTLCGRCVVEPLRCRRASRVRVTDDACTARREHARRCAGCWLCGAVIVDRRPDRRRPRWSRRCAKAAGCAVTALFTLVLTYNTGAAFSFLARASGWQRWLLRGDRLRRGDRDRGAAAARRNALYSAGLALILGGALGNLMRSPGAGQSRRLPAVPLRGVGVLPRSTSPTARSPSARRLLIFDSFRRPRATIRRSGAKER